jgi:hypothetical protein
MMRYAEFARRFRDHQEMGREMTGTHLLVFYDNGRDVGVWREDRQSTLGSGVVLDREDADLSRYWFRNGICKSVKSDRARPADSQPPPGAFEPRQ